MDARGDLRAVYLTAPKTGFRVFFEDECNENHLFSLWYASLKAAKCARTRMNLKNPIIVGYDGTVI